MANSIKGYICRSKNSNRIMICKGSKLPEKKEKTGWYWHVPGWFHTMSVRTFKKMFGFSIKPGTHEPVNISIFKEK